MAKVIARNLELFETGKPLDFVVEKSSESWPALNVLSVGEIAGTPDRHVGNSDLWIFIYTR